MQNKKYPPANQTQNNTPQKNPIKNSVTAIFKNIQLHQGSHTRIIIA